MGKWIWLVGVTVGAVVVSVAPAWGQRRAVLPQIDEPHSYYYRELYLPQLTSGPSSLTWGPDSGELIYSMAGSLVAAEVGFEGGGAADGWAGIRLPTGLVAGWEESWCTCLTRKMQWNCGCWMWRRGKTKR